MTDLYDPLMNHDVWMYDALTTMTSHTDAEGNTITFDYNDTQYPLAVTGDVEKPDGHSPSLTVGVRNRRHLHETLRQVEVKEPVLICQAIDLRQHRWWHRTRVRLKLP